uniref:ATP synthase F0 subunit 8 n=1 Tax=Pallenopsis pilosa TaxID=1306352 RepID=UPI00226D352A|nr:ATP synthase F0 subunit 8 [Pallenopsis pilosa]UZA61329.1 ATP synthase F0 subunit 8 [Pallenopsis pilosa]
MPQMMPMNWMILPTLFIFIMMTLIINNHYQIKLNLKKNNSNEDLKNKNWTW